MGRLGWRTRVFDMESEKAKTVTGAKPGDSTKTSLAARRHARMVEMTQQVRLGGNSWAPCPKCGHPIAVCTAKNGVPVGEVKVFADDTLVTLTCPMDGDFEVPTGYFRNKESSAVS